MRIKVLLMLSLCLPGILILPSWGAVNPIEKEQGCLKDMTTRLSEETLNEPIELGVCHPTDSEFEDSVLHVGECPNHDVDGDGRCDLQSPVYSKEGVTPVCPVGRC